MHNKYKALHIGFLKTGKKLALYLWKQNLVVSDLYAYILPSQNEAFGKTEMLLPGKNFKGRNFSGKDTFSLVAFFGRNSRKFIL